MAKVCEDIAISVRPPLHSLIGEMGACFPGDRGPDGKRGPTGDKGPAPKPSMLIFLSTVDDMSVGVGDPISYSFPGVFPGVPVPTKTVTGLPDGVTYNSATEQISGAATEVGDFVVTYTATVGSNSISQQSLISTSRTSVELPQPTDLLLTVGRQEVEQLPRGEFGSKMYDTFVYTLTGFQSPLMWLAARRIIQGQPDKIFGGILTYGVTDPGSSTSDSKTLKLCIIASSESLLQTANTRRTTEIKQVSGSSLPSAYGTGNIQPAISSAGALSVNAPGLLDIGELCGYHTNMTLEWKYAKDFVRIRVEGLSPAGFTNTDLQTFYNLMKDNTSSDISVTFSQRQMRPPTKVILTQPDDLSLPSIARQNFKIGDSSIQLPAAEGGTGDIGYSLTGGNDDVSFMKETRRLSGTRIFGGNLEYTAEDNLVMLSASRKFLFCITADSKDTTNTANIRTTDSLITQEGDGVEVPSVFGTGKVNPSITSAGELSLNAPGLLDIGDTCGEFTVIDLEWRYASDRVTLQVTGLRLMDVTHADFKKLHDLVISGRPSTVGLNIRQEETPDDLAVTFTRPDKVSFSPKPPAILEFIIGAFRPSDPLPPGINGGGDFVYSIEPTSRFQNLDKITFDSARRISVSDIDAVYSQVIRYTATDQDLKNEDARADVRICVFPVTPITQTGGTARMRIPASLGGASTIGLGIAISAVSTGARLAIRQSGDTGLAITLRNCGKTLHVDATATRGTESVSRSVIIGATSATTEFTAPNTFSDRSEPIMTNFVYRIEDIGTPLPLWMDYIRNFEIDEGQTIARSLVVASGGAITDDDKTSVYTISGLPTGLSFRFARDVSFNRRFTQIRGVTNDPGDYPITLTVRDIAGDTVARRFNLHVVKLTPYTFSSRLNADGFFRSIGPVGPFSAMSVRLSRATNPVRYFITLNTTPVFTQTHADFTFSNRGITATVQNVAITPGQSVLAVDSRDRNRADFDDLRRTRQLNDFVTVTVTFRD